MWYFIPLSLACLFWYMYGTQCIRISRFFFLGRLYDFWMNLLSLHYFLFPLFADSAGSNSFWGERGKQPKSKQLSLFSPTDLIKCREDTHTKKIKSPTTKKSYHFSSYDLMWMYIVWKENIWNEKYKRKMPGVLSQRKWRVAEHSKCLFCVYLPFRMMWLMCVSLLENQIQMMSHKK